MSKKVRKEFYQVEKSEQDIKINSKRGKERVRLQEVLSFIGIFRQAI